MAEPPPISTELLIELARRQGLDLGPERAEALKPHLESLLRRFARIAELLPLDSAAAPGPAPRFPR